MGDQDQSGSLPTDTMKACPFCAEVIKAEAIKCRYCGSNLSGDSQASAPAPPASGHPPVILMPPTAARPTPSISALALVGGVAVVAGAFLPWKSLGMISRSGVDGGGDGVYSALFGLLIVLAAAGPLRGWRRGLCVLFGLLAAGIGVIDYLAVKQDIESLRADDNPFADALSVGSGLYATMAGGALAVIGALTSKSKP